MSDLIDRQAAIDALMAWEEDSIWDEECLKHRGEPFWVAPSDVVEQLPSAQPEIIRCKECRYYEWMNNRVPAEQTWFCHNWNAETGKDDYCSYAERQEE